MHLEKFINQPEICFIFKCVRLTHNRVKGKGKAAKSAANGVTVDSGDSHSNTQKIRTEFNIYIDIYIYIYYIYIYL